MDPDELALARTQGLDLGDTDPIARTAAAEVPAAEVSPAGSLRAARIGRHAILRPLGEGAMGTVYLAYDEELDRKVALKLLHGETSGGTEGRARLIREAQALARLSHPNVVQIHEIGEHQGQVFVAMEHVDGATLSAWQRAEPRPLAAILRAYHQAGEGLLAAHRAGLVHRDFKPDNVLVGLDGRVRVADFGLARRDLAPAADLAATAPAAPVDVSATAIGAIVGTPAYMSPEQFRGRTADARSDIFSFCVALWEAVHGERPFAGATVHELADSVTAGRLRPPARELPARLQRALERGLAVDPDARWSTLEPLLAALAVDPEADPSGAARERRIFAGLAGLVGLCFFAVMGSAIARGEELVRARIIELGALGVLLLLVLTFAFRRSLLRNRYHRRVIQVFVVVAAVSASQRTFAILHGTPLVVVIVDTVHIIAAVTFIAAAFFVRWMALLSAYAAVAIVLAYVDPSLFPSALAVLFPAIALTAGWFWRRDARRGAP